MKGLKGAAALRRYCCTLTHLEDLDELIAAVFEAVSYTHLVDGQEVECAVIGSDPAVATRPGEILAGAEFYTCLLYTSRCV